MRFYIGAKIPDDWDANLECQLWNKLKEPSQSTMTLIALPLGGLMAFLLGQAWSVLIPEMRDKNFFEEMNSLVLAGICLLCVLVHEGIHALIHPGFGFSKFTIVGIVPHSLTFFAQYTREWGRSRFVLCLLAPFMLLSLTPFLLSMIIPEIRTFPWVVASCFNTFVSCGDLVGSWIILRGVPRDGVVCNRGYHSYWRLPS